MEALEVEEFLMLGKLPFSLFSKKMLPNHGTDPRERGDSHSITE